MPQLLCKLHAPQVSCSKPRYGLSAAYGRFITVQRAIVCELFYDARKPMGTVAMSELWKYNGERRTCFQTLSPALPSDLTDDHPAT